MALGIGVRILYKSLIGAIIAATRSIEIHDTSTQRANYNFSSRTIRYSRRFADDCITGPAAVISLKAEIPIKSHPRVNRCPFQITTAVSIRANMANGEFNSEFLRVPRSQYVIARVTWLLTGIY
jgi:hypothetical protein